MTMHRALASAGVIAGPLFLATATIEGARRPDYDPVRHPISSLALGPRGWVQAVNFAFTGSLYLATAAGVRGPRNRLPAIVFGLCGAALLTSAVFRTDPVSGYPPGTPDIPTPSTRIGRAHDISGVPIFLGIPAMQLTAAVRGVRKGHPAWAGYSAVSGATMAAAVVGATAAFGQAPRWAPYGGLLQRVAVVTGLGWLTSLAARTLSGKAS